MRSDTWSSKRIESLCEVTSSKRIFASDYVAEGVPFYRGREITEKFLGNLEVSTELFISENMFTSIEKKFGAPLPGDLLLTSVGTLGSAYVVKPGERFYFKDGNLTWFRNFNGFDSRFLFYWLISPIGKSELRRATIGVAQPALTIVNLKGMEISIPPYNIQRRIADILSAYDDLIENCQRRIRILETMALSLYREWFVHFRFPGHETHPRVDSPLGEIPKGWEVVAIASISAYVNRGLSPTYDENGESLVLNQKCIRDQRLSFKPARRQSKPIPIEKKIRFGDVLINSTGVGTLGRVAQLYQETENCTVDSHVTIVRPKDNIDMDFFGMSMMERQKIFERLGVGATGQTELNRASVTSVEFPIPTREIADRFGHIVRPMRKSAFILSEKIQNLRRTRDLLLPRLLSGQVELETN
ncbi:MAG: restriction endonuclease subunit S [Fibrobacteria bacterium]